MRFLVTILVLAFAAHSTNAQIATLTASDGHDDHQFGSSVDLSSDGSMLLVGAVGDDEAGDGAGAAYVFERSGNDWVETDKILNPDPVARFGEKVWLSDDGTRALISGSWCSGNSEEGRAWIYRRETKGWVLEERLQSDEPGAERCFANLTTLSGDGSWALVSDWANAESNIVYAFKRTGTTWELQHEFSVSRNTFSINNDGSIAMFVRGGISPALPEAIIYQRSGGDWAVRNEIETDVPTSCFGIHSALSDDGSVAVIGSPTCLLFNGRSPRSSGSGEGAFVFRESSGKWVLEANLPPTGASGEEPGWRVDISGDGSRVIYGAPAHYYPEASFHVFDWQGGPDWLNVRNHYNSGDAYSRTVAISNDGQWAAAGSPSFAEGSFVTVFGPSALPVELTSFTARADGRDVHLAWETSSETNNAGFEVQIKSDEPWTPTGFVEGHGTTTQAQSYTFEVVNLNVGTHTFRLKQIDFDGTFEYSPEVEATVELVGTHQLSAAYPNPFNPQSQFRLAVARDQHVTATLYNALGRRVAVLFNGQIEAQTTQVVAIDREALPSGSYFVRVSGETFVDALQITLAK